MLKMLAGLTFSTESSVEFIFNIKKSEMLLLGSKLNLFVTSELKEQVFTMLFLIYRKSKIIIK